jgi:flagellar protein FlbD
MNIRVSIREIAGRLTVQVGGEVQLIETIEKTPHTVITLINEHKYVVEDDVDDVIEKVVEYKQKLGKV